MKSIDNLVKDIYSLFDPIKETNLDEKEVDKHLDLFADSVKETLRMFLKEKPTQKRNLRLSAIGKPTRQLWYDKHSKDEPKPLEPYTIYKNTINNTILMSFYSINTNLFLLISNSMSC